MFSGTPPHPGHPYALTQVIPPARQRRGDLSPEEKKMNINLPEVPTTKAGDAR